MKEPTYGEQGLSKGLAIGIVIVFITMVLGTCFLVLFLYNLPVIFPPPGAPGQQIGLVTQTRPAPSPALQASLTPSRPPSTPTIIAPTLTPTPPSPNVPGDPPALLRGQVVFVTERNGFNSIFAMNADGTGQRLLVPHKGNYYDYGPAVSPDGSRIAFSSNREKPGTDNIYLMGRDGSNLIKITSTLGVKNASSSWFPDNRRLAFSSNRTGHWQAFVMNDDGGGVRQIISSLDDVINIAVAPNGNLVAYTCGREICLANSDGTNTRVLLKNGLPKDHLAWSPDSSTLAFSQVNANGRGTGIHVVDMQGNARQIIANGGWPSWSPEGTRLVFSSDMGGIANLYLYDRDTGQITRVTSTGAADINPFWAH